MTLIIKTNSSQLSDVLIRDMGILIPSSGGSETLSDFREIEQAKNSIDLRDLSTDDAFGVNSSTLILNDGTSDISQGDVETFLQNSNISSFTGIQGTTGLQGSTGIGSDGTTGIQGTTGLQGSTGIGSDGTTGIQGTTGLQGVTGVASLNSVKFIKLVDSAGNQQATSTTFSDFEWNTEVSNTGEFSFSSPSAEITFLEAGTYSIKSSITLDELANNSRSTWTARLLIDTGSGFSVRSGTTGYVYSRNNSQGIGTLTIIDIIEVSVNDVVKIQIAEFSGANTYQSVANSSTLIIQGVEGSQGSTGISGTEGNQGSTGLQGNTGFGLGVTGLQGSTGLEGNQGITGIQGLGATGLVGPTGIRGTTGIQGATGFGLGTTGLQGPTGIGAGGSSVQIFNLTLGGCLDVIDSFPLTRNATEISTLNVTLVNFYARRGVAGTSGTTTIELEVNGNATGDTLSWTSADANFALKSNSISQAITVGDTLSFRVISAEVGAEDIFVSVTS